MSIAAELKKLGSGLAELRRHAARPDLHVASYRAPVVPTGNVNGTNRSFTVPYAMKAGHEKVYLNGRKVYRAHPQTGYTVTVTGLETEILFVVGAEPQTGDTIEVEGWI